MGMENMGAMPVYEVNGSRNNDGFANSWIWVFFLFFLLAWGGNGFGFGGTTRAETHGTKILGCT